MKTSSDPRHQERIRRVQALFAYSYGTLDNNNLHSLLPHLPKIDEMISSVASDWPLKEINRIDLAILRSSVYELLCNQDVPAKVVIDEAVEIGKTYGAENTSGFVNGVLGAILKSIKK